jgi:hypothetical protein
MSRPHRLSARLDWMQLPSVGELAARRPPCPDPVASAAPWPSHRRVLVALGDSGDAGEPVVGRLSALEAIAEAVSAEMAPPVGAGQASALLHTGDLVDPCGEPRLWQRCVLQPFRRLLEPGPEGEPAVPLRGRVPFLAVPGNHDYADPAPWVATVLRTRRLGAALRSAARRYFHYPLPAEGSDRGRSYLRLVGAALPEAPAPFGAIPHRYYRCSLGPVELFAVDSNSLTDPACPDGAQLAWLESALQASRAAQPAAWRVLLLHHPLWTLVPGYCEAPEIRAVRAALLPVVAGRVHLILAGHAHAFEWLSAEQLPGTLVLTSGAGGHRLVSRCGIAGRGGSARRYRKELRAAGVLSAVAAGREPAAPDGLAAPLLHYLRIVAEPGVLRVTPVGMRRTGARCFRREEPLPVLEFPDMAPDSAAGCRRLLRGVELLQGEPAPRAEWLPWPVPAGARSAGARKTT